MEYSAESADSSGFGAKVNQYISKEHFRFNKNKVFQRDMLCYRHSLFSSLHTNGIKSVST
jgi:hypothetical protein